MSSASRSFACHTACSPLLGYLENSRSRFDQQPVSCHPAISGDLRAFVAMQLAARAPTRMQEHLPEAVPKGSLASHPLPRAGDSFSWHPLVRSSLVAAAAASTAVASASICRRLQRKARTRGLQWQGPRRVALVRRSHEHEHVHDGAAHGNSHETTSSTSPGGDGHSHSECCSSHGHSHGKSHGHSHESHSHEAHSHEAHSHEAHSHEANSHEAHSHEAHSHGHGHGCCGDVFGGHGHSHGEVPDWLPGAPAVRRLSDLSRTKTSIIAVTAAFAMSLLPWNLGGGLPGKCRVSLVHLGVDCMFCTAGKLTKP